MATAQVQAHTSSTVVAARGSIIRLKVPLGSRVRHTPPWGCWRECWASDAGVGLAATGLQVQVDPVTRASGMCLWPLLLLLLLRLELRGQARSAPRAVG